MCDGLACDGLVKAGELVCVYFYWLGVDDEKRGQPCQFYGAPMTSIHTSLDTGGWARNGISTGDRKRPEQLEQEE